MLKDICSLVFIVALDIIANTQNEPKCPSKDKCFPVVYICTIAYYLALKMAEIQFFIALGYSWVTFYKTSQTQKDKCGQMWGHTP